MKLVTIAIVLAAQAAHAEPERRAPGVVSYQRLYFRAGVVHVSWLSDSSELRLSGVGGPASLAVMDGPIAGSGVGLDPITRPAVIAGYRLPFGAQERWSVETVLSTPLKVRFRATGTLANRSLAPTALDGVPTGVPPLGEDLGEAEATPPIVTAVYRIATLGPVRPYAGTGISLLLTNRARATNPILTEVSQPRFDIEPGAGWVLQTGADVTLWRNVSLRVDVKYIAFLAARATVEGIAVRTPELPLFETAEVGTAAMAMTLNPLVVQVGAGVDF